MFTFSTGWLLLCYERLIISDLRAFVGDHALELTPGVNSATSHSGHELSSLSQSEPDGVRS